MMLDFPGYRTAHDAILAAIEAVPVGAVAPQTPDLGGSASCAHLGEAIGEAAKMVA